MSDLAELHDQARNHAAHHWDTHHHSHQHDPDKAAKALREIDAALPEPVPDTGETDDLSTPDGASRAFARRAEHIGDTLLEPIRQRQRDEEWAELQAAHQLERENAEATREEHNEIMSDLSERRGEGES